MNPNEEARSREEEDYWSQEAIMARQRATIERGWQIHLAKEKAKAEAKARGELPGRELEVAVKANTQSTRRVIERTREDLERAERERREAQYRATAQLANH
jgi:hypothetical protein